MDNTSAKNEVPGELLQDRAQELAAVLDRLSRDAFEAGLYDRNEMPEGASDT